MSNPVSAVLAEMSGKSWTLGWDALVAYDASALNELFAQRYVANVRNHQHVPPITDTIPIGGGVELAVDGLTLGSPLISFDPTLSAQEAIVQMNFIAGTLLVTEQAGSVKFVSGYQSVTPGDSFALMMDVDLQQVQGKVDQQHEVVVDLCHANKYVANLISGPSGAAYLGQYFQALFAKETPETLVYTLGTIVTGEGEPLLPVSFEIRTQAAPGSDGGGAVLLFVATTCNPSGGNMPGTDFPYLIPDSFGCAVVVGSETLFGNVIQAQYAATLAPDKPTFAVRQSAGAQPASYLEFTGGSLEVEPIRETYYEGGGTSFTYQSGSYHEPEPAFVPLSGLILEPVENQLGLRWSSSWGQLWTVWVNIPRAGATPHEETLGLSLSASFSTAASVGAGGVVSFAGSGTPSVSFPSVSWLQRFFSGEEFREKAEQVFAERAAVPASAVMNLDLPEVGTFSLDHLLFPASNVLKLSDVYVPGDLALFGQIEAPACTIAPLQSVVAAGQSVQLSVSGGIEVEWTIDPSLGSISPAGGYTAPPHVSNAIPVEVTAKPTTGEVITAVIVVVPGMSIGPAFQVVTPSTGPIAMEASVPGGGAAPAWAISPADGSVGTISAAGVYTPPASLPLGLTAATVTATSGNLSASALLLLSNAAMAFEVTPTSKSLGPGSAQQFIIDSSTAVEWSVLPASAGKVDGSGLYVAPSDGGPGAAVVVAQDRQNPNLVGFGLVILTGPG